MPKHVAIIGNGVAGVTAARFIRKLSDYRITMISGESEHFFSRPALMYLFMGHMSWKDVKPYEDWFWQKNRIDLVQDWVTRIDTRAKTLHLRDGQPLSYDVLIIATGARSHFIGWEGEDLEGVQGLVSLQDLNQLEARARHINRAVVVGGGLIGIELAEMLHTRNIPVTFLVREASFFDIVLPPEESEIINRAIRAHHIDLRLGTEVDALLGDAAGNVRAVRTNHGEEIPCEFVGITIGVTPNIDVVRDAGIETNRGVLVDALLQTNVPDVYAIGDCNEFREDGIGHRRADLLWYTAREHGKAVAKTICGHPTRYDRGVFFNSAKFLNVEWQTYGQVPPVLPEGEQTLVWQDPPTSRLVRINYDAASRCVRGFNLMNVRFRHDVCERWLLEERPVEYVLENLRDANFDPEFFRSYEEAFVAQYNRQQPHAAVQLKPRASLFQRLFA